ncbi:MAG: ATP-binding protein [Magnetococcus sp. YQC-5]
MLVISLMPAILMSSRHTPWIVWVVPMVLIYVFSRQSQVKELPKEEAQEEIPNFCFSLIHNPEQSIGASRARWQTTLIRWRTAIIALPDGVLLLDQNFALCWFNPEARYLLGLDLKRDLGVPLTYRIEQPILDDYLVRGEFGKSIELPSPVNGGLMLNFRFVLLEKENCWLVLVRDITEQYQLDRRHRDFIANISHELKTPVTVFRGLLEILPDLPHDSQQWENAVSLLQKQADRMQSLIEDQTTLLRLGPANHDYPPEFMDMHAFLREKVAEAEVLSGTLGHDFIVTVDRTFGFLANPVLLQCVVGNLLSNAVNHTHAQTEVRVVWNRDEIGRPTLIVSDNGPGIASYHLPRLTEKYYRVMFHQGSDYHGTGLGLSLVKEAMERCCGKLEIVSQPGVGSRFVCRFPTAMATEPEQ